MAWQARKKGIYIHQAPAYAGALFLKKLFIFIKDNVVKGKETGFMSKEMLQDKIEELLK